MLEYLHMCRMKHAKSRSGVEELWMASDARTTAILQVT